MRGSSSDPIAMETSFATDLEDGAAVHVGSQTMSFFHGDLKEQAYEARHLALTKKDDVIVLRNADPRSLKYWNELVEGVRILNLFDPSPDDYLSRVVLDAPGAIGWIRDNMAPTSKLMVFLPTGLEQEVAARLGIPLYGSPDLTERYGTKSGIRQLAEASDIAMSPGDICTTKQEIVDAVKSLLFERRFKHVVIKHDLSTGGSWMARVGRQDVRRLDAIIDKDVANGQFVDGTDVAVVEGWIERPIASVCAQIEIPLVGAPAIRYGWQQVLDRDGKTYIGAAPLTLTPRGLDSFMKLLERLAGALKARNAIGAYAPDVLITSDESAILLELNARVAATTFPLAIVKQVRGAIGSSFLAQHVTLKGRVTFSEVQEALSGASLLISNCDGPEARGVVPFNAGLLPFGVVDLVATAPTWDETKWVMKRARAALGRIGEDGLSGFLRRLAL